MRIITIILLLVATAWLSCKKESIITSPDASVLASTDSVHFDTVFTSVGSVTQSFTIINNNQQKLNISSISLAGGSTSAFSINVNGAVGHSFSNLQLDANDSLYVFVKVTIDPNAAQLPFLVRDSVEVKFNGNTKKIQLSAYGQNARFINGGNIKTNTTWNNTLPYVVLNPLTVDSGITLTILQGTKVYFNANAPLIVNGSLRAIGNYYDSTRIVFRGSRLDDTYKDLPGTWPGVVLNTNSRNNDLRYTSLLNAYQALIVLGGINNTPAKLLMNGCIISNAYDIGLYAYNTSISATNCLISQVGNEGNPGEGGSNVIITAGGNCAFNQCTFATYANYYQNHKQPVMYVSNAAGSASVGLNLTMDNSIIYGQGGITEDELVTQKTGTSLFSVIMRNVLYKVKNDPGNVTFSKCIKNADPLFDSINTSLHTYNFRLRDGSPCIDAGISGGPATDLDGKPRPAGPRPDMGCYEKQ
jgi:hypothetical protein